jgi:hypothetical protein
MTVDEVEPAEPQAVAAEPVEQRNAMAEAFAAAEANAAAAGETEEVSASGAPVDAAEAEAVADVPVSNTADEDDTIAVTEAAIITHEEAPDDTAAPIPETAEIAATDTTEPDETVAASATDDDVRETTS